MGKKEREKEREGGREREEGRKDERKKRERERMHCTGIDGVHFKDRVNSLPSRDINASSPSKVLRLYCARANLSFLKSWRNMPLSRLMFFVLTKYKMVLKIMLLWSTSSAPSEKLSPRLWSQLGWNKTLLLLDWCIHHFHQHNEWWWAQSLVSSRRESYSNPLHVQIRNRGQKKVERLTWGPQANKHQAQKGGPSTKHRREVQAPRGHPCPLRQLLPLNLGHWCRRKKGGEILSVTCKVLLPWPVKSFCHMLWSYFLFKVHTNAFFILDDPDEDTGMHVWPISAGDTGRSPGHSLTLLRTHPPTSW